MHRYVIKRLFFILPVALGLSFMLFLIMSFTRGTPGDIIFGGLASPEEIRALNEELGFYDPFFVKYFKYLKNALRGDFGHSYVSGEPVVKEIFLRFPTTLKLAMASILLAVLLGVPLGLLSAVKRYSALDSVGTVFSLAVISIPPFWLGLLLILFFSVQLGWFPTFGSDSLLHFVLPAITSGAGTFATLLRMTRSTMLEILKQDYVTTAYSKGADTKRVLTVHCLKNALIPIVTTAGVNFGYLLGGAIITESVFGMSGVGNLILTSVRSRDLPMVMGSVLLLAVGFSLINLALDVIYAFLDPRIKARYESY